MVPFPVSHVCASVVAVDDQRGGALALAAGLVGWSATAGSRIPGRRHPLVQAALGTALARATGARLGLGGPELRAGLRVGGAAAAVVVAGVTVAAAIPAVRAAMSARTLPQPIWRWLAYEIPLGTICAEETAYRGALGTVAARGFGQTGGRAVQAAAFGLSHVVDARGSGASVVGTVLVTGAAGWVFGMLAERSGSVVAPMLAHLAVNEAGAVAAALVQSRNRRY